LYTTIEDKLNQQSKELADRAKVIAELKNNLSDITDKYAKLKIEFEKQKQYCIQLNLNLRNQKKRATCPSSKSAKNITGSNFRNLTVFHFSVVYQNKNGPRKKLKLKTENHSNVNELKKLKEEYANFKKETNNEIENKKKELEIKNNELEQIKIELNNNKDNYEKRIEQLNKEITEITDIINKSKDEKQNLIDEYNKKLYILNEDLKKMMLENQKIKGFELEIENLQKQNKANNTIITRQKSEIERLKKSSQFNFKLIKEDNENLLKQINLLNDNFLQIDQKKREEKKSPNKEF
jgi:hypothetical protein